MRRPNTTALAPSWLLLASLFAHANACAPAPRAIVTAQSSGASITRPTPSDAAVVTVAPTAVEDAQPLPRSADAPPCPLPFDHANVTVAQVGTTTITACDLALDALSATREGSTPRSPRDVLGPLVRDVVFAREASTRGLDREPATQERVDRTLADALVRERARRGLAVPDQQQIERYLQQHRADFDREARVHVRAIATDSEASARDVLRALSAEGASFERIAAERSVLAGARRDEGDLGLATLEGNDLVPAPVAQRAHALAEHGELAPEPVRVSVTTLVGRRRRPRTSVRWFVVQRLERVEAEPATVQSVARRITFRLVQSQWRERLSLARAELLTEAREHDAVTIDQRALRSVTLRRDRPARRPSRPSRGSAGRGRVAAPRRR